MIIDTVFSPSFGNRPTYLVGREGVLVNISQSLSSQPGSRDRASVILGQRGSGKTVLLWEIAERAREQGFVVASPTIASQGMLERIVEKIQEDGSRYVSEKAATVSGGSIGAFGFSAGLQFTKEVQKTKSFEYKLVHLARRLTEKGHGVLILVDELQANSPEVRRVVIAYQEMVGEGLDVSLIMAGLPSAVSATLNDKVLTFLNRASKMQLSPLGVGDIDAFFRHAFKELGVQVSAERCYEAATATQGSPYLLQLIGHYIVLAAGSNGALDAQAFEFALSQAQADFENDVCETTLIALSDKDVSFLRAMAADGEESRMANIAERMGVSPDYAQKYRRRLIESGVIAPNGRGKVKFAVPYLADHLRKEDMR